MPRLPSGVTELDGVASALATVDAARLEAIQEPSPRLEQRIVGRVRRSRRGERRRVRVRRLATAFAAVAAAAITAVSLISLDADPPAVPTEPVTFAQVAAGIDVEGELIAHTWGVEVNFVPEGLEDGQRYIARLESADGEMIGAERSSASRPVRSSASCRARCCGRTRARSS
jgi:hypothetical protein